MNDDRETEMILMMMRMIQADEDQRSEGCTLRQVQLSEVFWA